MVGKRNLNTTNEWIIHNYSFKRVCLNAWASVKCDGSSWNRTVSSSGQAKYWTEPLHIDDTRRNEFLSTTRNNDHLDKHLLKWSDWSEGIKMILNNLLSIERGGLANSQGDYILRQSQCILSWVVMIQLQGRTMEYQSHKTRIITMNQNHHHHHHHHLI